MEKNGCKNLAISAAIWLGSGFVSIVLMALLTGIVGAIPYAIYFMLPNMVIFITAAFIQGLDIFKGIIGLFTSKVQPAPSIQSKGPYPKSYGRSAIWISPVLYFIGGGLVGFWAENHVWCIVNFMAVGIPWGFIVCTLYQKGLFHHDEF